MGMIESKILVNKFNYIFDFIYENRVKILYYLTEFGSIESLFGKIFGDSTKKILG